MDAIIQRLKDDKAAAEAAIMASGKLMAANAKMNAAEADKIRANQAKIEQLDSAIMLLDQTRGEG